MSWWPPPVTYLEIVRAALLPALLYYFSLLLVVHLQARRQGSGGETELPASAASRWPGIVFAGAFATLILLLLLGYTPFRAVSVSLVAILALAAFRRDTRVGPSGLVEATARAAHSGVALLAAAACVGTRAVWH